MLTVCVVGGEEPEELWEGFDQWTTGGDDTTAQVAVYRLSPQSQYVAADLCHHAIMPFTDYQPSHST